MSWKRGAYPEFTLEDAVSILFMLRNPVGRKAISDALELGEGSVRTLLRKLSNLGLIESSQRGHVLSQAGEKLLKKLQESFSEAVEVGTVEGMPAMALLVREPGEFRSIELRDEAIRFFARGAMILLVKNGEVVFPEDGRPLRATMPELVEKLEKLPLEEGALVIITWAESPSKALKSAYHVALFLKGGEIPEEIKSLVR
jgi:predicted transcriptional regulator